MGIWQVTQKKHTLSMISRGFRRMSEHISELIGARQPFAIWLTDGGIVPPRRHDWRLVTLAKTGKQIVDFVESYKDCDRFYSVNLQGLEFLGQAWGFQEARRQYLSINTNLSYLSIVLTIL